MDMDSSQEEETKTTTTTTSTTKKKKSYGSSPAFLTNLKRALQSRNGEIEEESEMERAEKVSGSFEIERGDPDSRPVVLLTNEEGIQALGLRAMVEALISEGLYNVYVCTPDCEYSRMGHAISPRKVLEVTPVNIDGAIAYEVSGTPAECISLSLSGVLFHKMPSLVISGINKGSNCGYHIFSSGTIAGAREASISGVPSLALSLDWKDEKSQEKDFITASVLCLPFIHAAMNKSKNRSLPRGAFVNINIPTDPSENKGFRITKQGTSRSETKWQIATRGYCKRTGIGLRVAQLGLAASAVGAARLANSPLKNIEVESVAGPGTSSLSSNGRQKVNYERELIGVITGEAENTYDFGALQEGYVTVTPLGSFNLDSDIWKHVSDWIVPLDLPLGVKM